MNGKRLIDPLSSSESKEHAVFKKVNRLIQSGDLLGAANELLAIVRKRRLSREERLLLKVLCLRLETEALSAFRKGEFAELGVVAKVARQFGSYGLAPGRRLERFIENVMVKLREQDESRVATDTVRGKPSSKKAKPKKNGGRGKASRKKSRKKKKSKHHEHPIQFHRDAAKHRKAERGIRLGSPGSGRLGEGRPPERATVTEQVETDLKKRRGGSVEPEILTKEGLGYEATEFPVAVRDAVIERTPHMDLNVDEPLVPGGMFSVFIYADEEPARPEEESGTMSFRVPEGTISFEIEVQLLFTSHFVWVPEGLKFLETRMVIDRNNPKTEKLKFDLMVRDAGELERTQPAITAVFRYMRRPSGKVTRKVSIQGLKMEPPSPPKDDETIAPRDPERPSNSLNLAHDAATPDLVISVLEREDKDGRNFDVILDSGTLPERWSGKWSLGKKTDEIVKGAMATFETASSPSLKLKGAGIAMFSSSPPEFQKMFWKMVDRQRLPRHILIISEEPYIPWELMVPQRTTKEGKIETRDALGVEFSVGRWITNKYISPPQKIEFSQAWVVAPDYPVGRKLKHSAAEVATIRKCFQSVGTISPALIRNIDDTLGQNGAALLHFVCHGKAGIPQSISLEQDKEQLSCWDIKALNGFLSAFQRSRTFVFLNACEVGRAAPELVGIGGFGNSFASIGASAVIAPLWSVDDGIAHLVAETFYERVVSQPTIPFAEILRTIRAKAYAATGEDTWAAYCFYGDPMAKLV
jgi:hypothetical protein